MKYSNKEKSVVTLENMSIPRGHPFWISKGVADAEAAGEIELVVVPVILETPELHRVSGSVDVEINENGEHYIERSPAFEPLPVEELLSIRLIELKELRNKSLEKGFLWEGYYANADTDSQGAIYRRLAQFDSGMRGEDESSSYKIAPGVFITFEDKAAVTAFSVAMTNFVEAECFEKEEKASDMLVAMTQQELLDVVMEDIFSPDHG